MTTSKMVFNSRRSTQQRQKSQYPFDSEATRHARRLHKQQKRLEKVVGLDVVDSVTEGQQARSKAIRYQDIKVFEPLTDTQEDFYDSWESDQAIGYMLSGSAGAGKSFLAIYKGLLAVLDPDTPYHKLIIIRSSTQVRQQGHLPGSLDEKMAAFETPYIGLVQEITGKKDAYQSLKDAGKIEFMSTSTIRGVTLNNAIIVADEVSSMNWHECKSIVTRVGKNSKIIMIGDTAQVDLIYNKNDTTGINDLLKVTKNMPSFRNFTFTIDDIVRSGMVKDFLVSCDRLGL